MTDAPQSSPTVARLCRFRLSHHYKPKLLACLEGLPEDDLRRRLGDGCNSVEGTVRHMLAHLRIVIARAQGESCEGGIEETFPETELSTRALADEVTAVIDEYCGLLDEGREPQVDGLLHLVEHLGYHLGQVVLLTRLLTGRRFDFVKNGVNEAGLRRVLGDS